jgi:pimeloyl-ACP methyl ester carboxylesterase
MDDGGLGRRLTISGGKVAYEVFGDGPPLVLVHGTPSRAFIWRATASQLSKSHTVYVYDLLGFGESERGEGQDVSIAAQARALAELVEAWGLERPAIAGHDIGGGIALRAHLLERVEIERLALLDPVVLTPWGTPTLKHVKANLEAYRSMPTGPFEAIVASHLRTATNHPLAEEAYEAYLEQWRGEEGKTAYLRKDEQLDEKDTKALEPLLGSVAVPVRILWGEEDAWLDPALGQRLQRGIPSSELEVVPGAGHFVMEDAPETVARALEEFFAASDQKPSR